jgi:hypothetical protein
MDVKLSSEFSPSLRSGRFSPAPKFYRESRMKLYSFPGLSAETVPDINYVAIEALEKMLAQVKSGFVTQIGLAGATKEQGIVTAYTPGEPFLLSGAVSHLLHCINLGIDELPNEND